ncbi:PepSY domain-containing protein [Tenuifilum osseticum]|uniref:PepSY domain-containing protein n=1 Tax=Tenuifilum osseticum TaxID=3374723 RepID=UPI0034E5BC7F
MRRIAYYFRKWHSWIGVVFTLPLIIISITGIILAFQDSFKNTSKEPQINVKWLPGYSEKALRNEFENKINEVFSIAISKDSTYYYGTGAGVFYNKNDSTGFFSKLAGLEIRCVVVGDLFLFAGGKQGLFRVQLFDQSVTTILSKDIHSICLTNDSTLIVSDKKNLYVSNDYGSFWKNIKFSKAFDSKQFKTENPKMYKIPLHKLNLDLHTGKAFFGKKFDWLWIVFVSLSLLFLTLTGLYMWIKKKTRMKIKT